MNGDDTILRLLLGTKEEDKEDEVVASSEDRILLFAPRPLDAFVAAFVIIALTEVVKNIMYIYIYMSRTTRA